MAELTLAFFVLTALLGAFLAAGHLRHRRASWELAITHGGLALASIFLVIITVAQQAIGVRGVISITLLLPTVIFGGILAALHFSRRGLPVPLVVLHAGFAASVILLLTASIFSAEWGEKSEGVQRAQQQAALTPLPE